MIKARFEDLTAEQQAQARDLFGDASVGDGYLYKDHTDHHRVIVKSGVQGESSSGLI